MIFWRLSWRRLRRSRIGPVVRADGVGGRARSVARSPRVVGDKPAGRASGGVERVVPRGKKNVVASELQGACEVDGVVAAQRVLGGEVAGLKGERFVDRDDAQLGVELLERCDASGVSWLVDATCASCRGERGARLGVDELAGDEQVGAIPELNGELGAGFVEDQLDQRRRIEVDDQRRWSATRSDTGVAVLSRARRPRGLRGAVGSRTRPRARRSARGSVSSTGTRRATRRPRIVTTTSAPSLTCWT